MNSQSAKREDLRLYLLGLITPEERQAVEERMITNESDYDEVFIAEEELIDDYLANKLSEAERQAFDTHFMNPPERQEDLRFAQALKTYVSANDADVVEPTEQSPSLVPKPERRFFAGWIPATGFSLRIPLAVAAVLLIAVLSWVGYRNLTPPRPTQVIAVTLSGGAVTREGGSLQTVKLQAGEVSVQFKLLLPSAPFESYQAALRDANGKVLLTGEKTKRPTADQKIVVNVPGSSLPNGDYQFVLTGIDDKGESDVVGNYRFRVAR